jgi:hypothetical protein
VHHRRLKERLASNQEWIEVEGTMTAQKILGGLGNIDDNVIEVPGGAYRAAAVRAYDPEKKQWRSGGSTVGTLARSIRPW